MSGKRGKLATPRFQSRLLTPTRRGKHAVRHQGYGLILIYFLAVASASGCGLHQWVENGFKVGPNYCKPPVPVAPEWIDYQDAQVRSEPADLAAWWAVFGDPTLNSLVQSANQQNISLRVAGARIMEASYRRRIAAGYFFPQVQDLTGSFSAIKMSENIAFRPARSWYTNWATGLNATWELDFWGRYRRAIEAADAELDASIENYDDVLVLLFAEVSQAYVDYRTSQQLVRVTRANVAAQEQSLKIAEDKARLGVATERDVQQARTVLERTRAAIPRWQETQRQASNRLCVLLGFAPRDLETELGEAPIPTVPPEVVIGIPADLVRRRPDVRRAEREVAAQSARVGIAVSDLYPHFTLNGTFGVAAEDFGKLFDGQRSLMASVGPAFRWDLLNYGRLVNNIGAQDAAFQQLAYTYQQTVLEAGREAEDGIVEVLRRKERVLSLGAAAAAAARTRDITYDQYRQGVVDFTAVFIAESELAQSQDQLAFGQGELAQGLIKLYKALGGGWEFRLRGPRGAVVAAAEYANEDEQPRPAGELPSEAPATP